MGFQSTGSQSRINFPELLRAEHKDDVINAGAVSYREGQRLSREGVERLEGHGGEFREAAAWEAHLETLKSITPRYRRLATEGALMGSLLAHGFAEDLVIVSDETDQFKVFQQALCGIPAERNINEIVP